MLSKVETAGVGILLYFLLNGGKSKAATAAQVKPIDGELLKRANQPAAFDPWHELLMSMHPPLPDDLAAAVCRWIGIESSGNPLAVSSQGERGLTQITKTSALTEGALTEIEWEALANPYTTHEEQARIAWKIVEWCWARAKKYVQAGAHRPADALPSWPALDAIDQLWYAKMYHQAPVEVRDGQMSGDAAADSRRLEGTWGSDGKKLRHLHAANVVAWNSIEPPRVSP